MKKHIQEMSESRAAMEVLTAKIRVEIQAAEYEKSHCFELFHKIYFIQIRISRCKV